MQLHRSAGYYIPAAFMLYVDTDTPIDALIGTAHERVLAHELVHFLQDVSTTYGMVNICKYVDALKGLSVTIRSKASMSVPFEASEKPLSANINNDLFSIYIGDGAEKYMTHPSTVKLTEVAVFEESIDHVPTPVSCIEIEYGGQRRFQYGAMAIMESMAHIVEEKIYGTSSIKSFPYDSAMLVAAYLIPSIQGNSIAVLELCEASLMFLNPAEIFVESAKRIQQDNVVHARIGDYYNYVIHNFKLEKQSGIDYFSEISGQTQKHLDDLFTVAPFKEEHWGSDVVKAGSRIRESGSSIATFLFGRDVESPRDQLFTLITSIGFPPSFNNKHKAWVHNHEKSRHTQLMYPAIASISELLEKGKSKCCLYDYCINEAAGYTANELCISAPWKRAKENMPCYYAHVWKMWGHEECSITERQ